MTSTEKNPAKRVTLGWLLMLAVAHGCSAGNQENDPPKAVEVGNPRDPKPTKHSTGVEHKILVVELQPVNLQEIEAIDFFVDTIQLRAADSSGQSFELSREEGTETKKLSLRPGVITTMRFRLPTGLEIAKATTALELGFSEPSPGNVSVGGRSIAIQEGSESLLLPIDVKTDLRTEKDLLVTKQNVQKDTLFEATPITSGVVKENESPVYRLKTSL